MRPRVVHVLNNLQMYNFAAKFDSIIRLLSSAFPSPNKSPLGTREVWEKQGDEYRGETQLTDISNLVRNTK